MLLYNIVINTEHKAKMPIVIIVHTKTSIGNIAITPPIYKCC